MKTGEDRTIEKSCSSGKIQQNIGVKEHSVLLKRKIMNL
jgi:hypothetical protein